MKKPVDWSQIETLMRHSISGGRLEPEEFSLLQRANLRHPSKYSALHKKVKRQEDDRMAMRDPK